jgi:multidrug efflux pump subunit AcrA (membrane-fusion protein)
MRKREYESIKLIQPPASIHQVAKWSSIVFFILIIMFAILPWQQTATGVGRVIAYSPSERQQNITAPVDGRLGKWYVQEGTIVKKGDPILDIYDNDPAIIDRIQLEKSATSKNLALAEQAAEIAQINVKRQHDLFKQGITARKTYEAANLEYVKYRNNVENLKAELARIDVKLSRQHSQKIIAPMTGSILRRYAGQESVLVKAGDIIAELVPDTTSRAVELWIDGNDVPLVSIGDEVRLQFEGWPGIQFSGWPSVAIGTFGGVVSVIDAADDGHGQFRLLVTPSTKEQWPEPRYLRQGVRAHGWVLLGRVSLWFELWRRFNGFPPTQSKKNEK